MTRRLALPVLALALAACGSGTTVYLPADDVVPDVPADVTADVPADAPADVPADDVAPDPGPDPGDPPRSFRFAVVSDPHIIDEFYDGVEGSPLDTESLQHTKERLEAARAALMALPDPPELVVLPGDIVHNYPSDDPAFYETHRTRFDIAADLLASFGVVTLPSWGNHDYRPSVPRELTHQLLQSRFGRPPYYAHDHMGWTFLMLDPMIGPTQTPGDPAYDSERGSLGSEQLDWLEAQLARGRPTVVVVHHPLDLTLDPEGGRPGLRSVLKAHAGTVRQVLAGHMHLWLESETDGLRELVCGSTRYDPDAYVVAEADAQAGTVRFLNRDCWLWLGHDATPWDPVAGCTPP